MTTATIARDTTRATGYAWELQYAGYGHGADSDKFWRMHVVVTPADTTDGDPTHWTVNVFGRNGSDGNVPTVKEHPSFNAARDYAMRKIIEKERKGYWATSGTRVIDVDAAMLTAPRNQRAWSAAFAAALSLETETS